MPQRPHELGWPVQAGASPAPSPATDEAKIESFFVRRTEPHAGQGVPCHVVERTSTSLSRPQSSQWNS
ncbi:MAG TPA: hypothetical protein PKE47_03015 [Verrucomicrobiota bacterium]|nr:hypothetical protein [Verrucomicrobiota bacterium]